MRRLPAAVLVVSVLLFGVQASAQHVHAYVDHDHEEHHHGPDSHDHGISVRSDDPAHVSACDPSAHIVRISYIASPTTDVQPVVGEIVATAVILRVPGSVHAVTPLDVRGHGPPPARCYSLRAPPPQTFL